MADTGQAIRAVGLKGYNEIKIMSSVKHDLVDELWY